MLQRTGRIEHIDGHTAAVSFPPATACGRCSAGRGCGSALFAFSRRAPQIIRVALPEHFPAAPGDSMTLSVSGSRLLRMALLAYLVPLAGLAGGAWLLPLWFPARGDGPALIGMLLGLGVACLALVAARHRPGTVSIARS